MRYLLIILLLTTYSCKKCVDCSRVTEDEIWQLSGSGQDPVFLRTENQVIGKPYEDCGGSKGEHDINLSQFSYYPGASLVKRVKTYTRCN